jgi:hypothetical protein
MMIRVLLCGPDHASHPTQFILGPLQLELRVRLRTSHNYLNKFTFPALSGKSTPERSTLGTSQKQAVSNEEISVQTEDHSPTYEQLQLRAST